VVNDILGMSAVVKVRVAVPGGKGPQLLDYALDGTLSAVRGQLVAVPLRSGTVTGVVWAVNPPDIFAGDLKVICEVLPLPTWREGFCAFLEWAASYSANELGAFLKMALSGYEPATGRSAALSLIPGARALDVALNTHQHTAVAAITEALASPGYRPFLLDGVTGSGKTEVFLAAANAALAKGQQVLLLVPEIALATSLAERIAAHCDAPVVVWHSDITPAKRRNTWKALSEGKPMLVLAARSGLFLPLPCLGLLIVDEEHDTSYKQEGSTLYHGRDLAVARAFHEKITVVLASATPSFETLYNAENGKYTHLTLPARAGGAVMPTVQVVDLCKAPLPKGEWIAGAVREAVTAALSRGEQALLFLNRRGYAPLTLCKSCGHRWRCPSCSAWLVAHQYRGKRLQCHHCGYQAALPDTCPACDSKDTVITCGPGIERIAEEAAMVFPNANRLLLSSDHLQETSHWEEALQQIRSGAANLLIGTQVIAKGHDFPNLTTIAVLDADIGLAGGDVRAAEKTWALLHQVSGRAGRGSKPGTVYLQTYQAQHPVLLTLARGDRDGFFKGQLQEREIAALPPFGRLAAVIISGREEAMAKKYAGMLAGCIPPLPPGVQVLGPAPAPLALLKNWHRVRFLIKSNTTKPLAPLLRQWLAAASKTPKDVKISLDIDPVSFL